MAAVFTFPGYTDHGNTSLQLGVIVPITCPGQDNAVSPGSRRGAAWPRFQKHIILHEAFPGQTHDGVHWSVVLPRNGNDLLAVAGSGCLPARDWPIVVPVVLRIKNLVEDRRGSRLLFLRRQVMAPFCSR
jgi:hypothetical protein